jgi:cholesterol oxidase
MNVNTKQDFDYDWVIIGSGFGGSAAALRLSQKGYKVLVLEQGKTYAPEDFPETNWDLKRWLWLPSFGMTGPFRISLYSHLMAFSGVGVGGGSLVYANTLPVPKEDFFQAPSWGHLADWQSELKPHYKEALRMLGATPNPYFHTGDYALKAVGEDIGKGDKFSTVDVAVYFKNPNQEVPDPFFGGEGPPRSGCNQCGSCMIGCKHGAKNTLDKNYLWLAKGKGAEVRDNATVRDVRPLDGAEGKTGYEVTYQETLGWFKDKFTIRTRGVVFAAGSQGTSKLMLKFKRGSLPRLSEQVGRGIRTNSESLLGATTFNKNKEMSKGVAISSILQVDERSHLEVVRYSSGSGFFRAQMTPAIQGRNFLDRTREVIKDYLRDPKGNFKGLTIDDWAKRTQILLFMQTVDSTLQFQLGQSGLMGSKLDKGPAPTPFIPEAHELAHRFAEKIDGKAFAVGTETFLGIPSSAHILGGACMGRTAEEGVVDSENRVHGYQNMLVLDGSMISANPGVNPSLSILAIAERALERAKLA